MNKYTFDGTTLGTPGACVPHVLMAQADSLVTPAPLSVSLDMDPLHRAQGQELWIYFDAPLTAQEESDIADAVALHENTDAVAQATIMTTASDGAIPPGGQCWVSTGIGPVELTLPKVSDASLKHIVIKRVGPNTLTIKPHLDEQGQITIDGGASHIVADGAQIVIGDDGANWVNLGSDA